MPNTSVPGEPAPASLELEGWRRRIGERLLFRYDSGATLTGVLLEVRPATGVPQLFLLSEADFFDDRGTCLQHLPFFPLVVSRLEGIEPAPTGRS